MASITHTQTRTIISGPMFRVSDVITAATDIPMAVFVFKVTDDTFSHVATVYDLSTYPDTREQAVEAEQDFYRQTAVTKDWESLGTAIDFAESIKPRLKLLVKDFEKASDLFVGVTVETVES